MKNSRDQPPVLKDLAAFRDRVIAIMHQYQIARFLVWPIEVIDESSITLRGRHISLDNLYRIVALNGERGDPRHAVKTVENYVKRLMDGEMSGDDGGVMPFEQAKKMILPRLQPKTVFEHLDRGLAAHQEFVNDTVIVYVLDYPHITVSITNEQVDRWGVAIDDLDQLARLNLATLVPQLEIQLIESGEGGRAAIIAACDSHDAARLLMPDLHERLASHMRGNFYVATPSRDMFVAMTCRPPEFAERMKKRITRDYQRLPYPITDRLFLVTRDGIAGDQS